jgi:CheY-like chemotaxis protein
MREVLRLALEIRGYSVEEAADGEEALAILRRNRSCCVILLDLMMPGMNGWQFRKAQLESPEFAAIPVVVLSAMRDARSHAAELGAAACLMKPLDTERLIAEIARHCGA